MKKKRKIRKKAILIIVSFFVFLIILGIGTYYYLYYQKVVVSLKNHLTVRYMDTVTNVSFVKKVKGGKIITKSKNIDTSKLGKQKITLDLKNKLGRKEKYTFEITVIDTVPPEITYQDSLSTIEGIEIDLLKDVVATDNIDKEIEVKVVGNYDFQKVGTYSLTYVAKDSSGNETSKEFQLTVQKKPTETYIPPNNPDVAFTTSKGFQGYTQNGLTYIDGVLIANKTYRLPSNYGSGLTNATQQAFHQMRDAAASEGLEIHIISGFRSYSSQNSIYHNYVARDGKEAADRYSARAGHSEHQTGLAVDINSLYTSFENTPEGKWLSANSYRYGFILRYTKDGESITGYMYEPWHFRYVGIDLATKLYNQGNWVTLEEYFGITSKYE